MQRLKFDIATEGSLLANLVDTAYIIIVMNFFPSTCLPSSIHKAKHSSLLVMMLVSEVKQLQNTAEDQL